MVVGIVLLGVGLLAAGLESNNHSVCTSTIGLLARGLSQTAQRDCAVDDAIYVLGIVAAIVGGVIGLVGLIVGLATRQSVPQSVNPPPGWYPPAPGQSPQWWDGNQWVQWASRPLSEGESRSEHQRR